MCPNTEMTMQKSFVEQLFAWGPLWFGLGFMAPVLMTLFERAGWSPLGLSPLAAGLLIGAVYGAIAKVRGRWI